jgi:hypothetical protein
MIRLRSLNSRENVLALTGFMRFVRAVHVVIKVEVVRFDSVEGGYSKVV